MNVPSVSKGPVSKGPDWTDFICAGEHRITVDRYLHGLEPHSGYDESTRTFCKPDGKRTIGCSLSSAFFPLYLDGGKWNRLFIQTPDDFSCDCLLCKEAER